MDRSRQERLWRAAGISLVILAVILMALHLVAVFTESINWDEFAFLFRGDNSLRTGSLHSGGRPGLALLALLPFASGCSDSVSAIRSARLLWSLVTIASVLGFFYLLRNAIPQPRYRFGCAGRFKSAPTNGPSPSSSGEASACSRPRSDPAGLRPSPVD